MGTGDITAVNAGMGLTGGETAGDVTLAADTTVLQRRVTGTCAVGSSMRVVNGDGTVACEADDNTTYSTGPDSTNTYYDPWWYPQPGGNVDSFNVRATGGVYLVTSVDDLTAQPTAGVIVTGGGSGWNSYSDRNAKENVVPADGRAILDRLAAIPVQTWNYKTQAPAIRHIGPMAQDFAAAFAVGENDTTINSIDADGVALAAIPGLYQVVQEQDARLAAQQEKIQALEAQNAGFEQRLAALEQRAGAAPAGLATLPATLPWAGGLVLALAGLGARRLAGGGR